jgi:multiple sugar transport system ATP-binding protein
MPYIQFKSIVKSFGAAKVLHGIDLEIEEGEFTVLVGPSGCGKTTLLRIIAGIEELSSGSIHIGQERVDSLPPSKRGIAMVFQNYALYPHMTVFENMSFGLRLAKAKKDFIKERINYVAEILQIKELLERKPKTLSGGQRQRAAIGRAIVREPNVFLFDEPLSNLDAELRVKMRVELSRLHRKLEATMIYVTHDQVEAMTMADKIVVLNQGMIEQTGSPLELYNYPNNKFVAGFIGSPAMNFLEGRITEIEEKTIKVVLESELEVQVGFKPNSDTSIGDTVTLGIRPEAMNPNGKGEGCIIGNIDAVERLGGETYFYVTTKGGAEITVHTPMDIVASNSDDILIGFPMEKCYLFNDAGKAFKRIDS